VPARDGVLRVLKVARRARPRKAAHHRAEPSITGIRCRQRLDETSWTIHGGEMSAYVRQATRRAAWDFMTAEGMAELSAINQAFGPSWDRLFVVD
jgi:hypothetical protein